MLTNHSLAICNSCFLKSMLKNNGTKILQPFSSTVPLIEWPHCLAPDKKLLLIKFVWCPAQNISKSS